MSNANMYNDNNDEVIAKVDMKDSVIASLKESVTDVVNAANEVGNIHETSTETDHIVFELSHRNVELENKLQAAWEEMEWMVDELKRVEEEALATSVDLEVLRNSSGQVGSVQGLEKEREKVKRDLERVKRINELEKEVEKLEEVIEDLKDGAAATSNSPAKSEATGKFVVELENTVEVLRGERNELKASIEMHETKSADDQKEKDALKELNAKLETNVKELSMKVLDYEDLLETMEHELLEGKDKNALLFEDIERVTSSTMALKSSITVLEQKVDEQESTILQKDIALGESQEQLDDIGEIVNGLEASLRERTETIEHLRTEVVHQQTKIDEQGEKLDEATVKIASFEEAMSTMKAEFDRVQCNKDKLERDHGLLKKDMKNKKEMIEKMTNDLSTLVEKDQANLTIIMDNESEKMKMTTQLKELERSVIATEKKVTEAKRLDKDNNDHIAELETQQNVQASLISEYEKKLRENKSSRSEMERTINRLEEIVEDLNEALKEKQRTLKRSEERLQKQKLEYENYDVDRPKILNDMEKLKGEKSELQTVLENSEKELAKRIVKLEAMLKVNADRTARIEELESKSIDQKAVIADLTSKASVYEKLSNQVIIERNTFEIKLDEAEKAKREAAQFDMAKHVLMVVLCIILTGQTFYVNGLI